MRHFPLFENSSRGRRSSLELVCRTCQKSVWCECRIDWGLAWCECQVCLCGEGGCRLCLDCTGCGPDSFGHCCCYRCFTVYCKLWTASVKILTCRIMTANYCWSVVTTDRKTSGSSLSWFLLRNHHPLSSASLLWPRIRPDTWDIIHSSPWASWFCLLKGASHGKDDLLLISMSLSWLTTDVGLLVPPYYENHNRAPQSRGTVLCTVRKIP